MSPATDAGSNRRTIDRASEPNAARNQRRQKKHDCTRQRQATQTVVA